MEIENCIKKPIPDEYTGLVNIWAAAVRATHDFLSAVDFQNIQDRLADTYFPAVDLYGFYYPDITTTGLAGRACAAWNGTGALPENGLCAGFMGLSDVSEEAAGKLSATGLYYAPAKQVEMLFVDPAFHRRGIGRSLLDFARRSWPCLFLDVNEQNGAAAQFYFKYGFTAIGRSELDGQGRPYPLLHLCLKPNPG